MCADMILSRHLHICGADRSVHMGHDSCERASLHLHQVPRHVMSLSSLIQSVGTQGQGSCFCVLPSPPPHPRHLALRSPSSLNDLFLLIWSSNTVDLVIRSTVAVMFVLNVDEIVFESVRSREYARTMP